MTLPLPAGGLVRGAWQLSRGHGPGWSRKRAFAALDEAAARPGPLFLDCADIYTGAEQLLGDWLAARPASARQVVVFTKFVPDLDALATVDRNYVRGIVLRSRDRLGVEALELVQFAWWDLSQPGWLRAAEWLTELGQEGVVRNIGVTNFDCGALTALLDAGIPVISNQVQFSLLDRRPQKGMTDLCLRRSVTLLCYGALAGGLLSDAAGAAAPSRSLVKYRLVADEVGGRAALERACAALAEVAGRHRATMADVAVAYVLRQPAVGAVIVGLSRRGRAVGARRLRLEPGDERRLEAAVPGEVPGEVFGLERDRNGPHGRIMRYNLNRDGSERGASTAETP